MKKILTILVLVLVGYSAFYWLIAKDKIVKNDIILNEVEIKEEIIVIEDSVTVEDLNDKFCFSRTQVATEDAPYSAEEYIELNLKDNVVIGTKEGTQAGPDMTNGYLGTLTGERVGDLISVIFSYTIEGSAQKEKEEYILKEESLVKQRYSLIEDGDLLVPDKESEVTEIVYKKDLCE